MYNRYRKENLNLKVKVSTLSIMKVCFSILHLVKGAKDVLSLDISSVSEDLIGGDVSN